MGDRVIQLHRPGHGRGRPRDGELTDRLLEGVLGLLADEGPTQLSIDGLTKVTGAGRGSIYRRWESVLDAAAEAVAGCALIPGAADTGTLTGDMLHLLEPFGRHLRRDERAAAALVGVARHHTEVRGALQQAVVTPLHEAVSDIVRRHADRSGAPSILAPRLLTLTVTSLWWDRYITAPRPRTPAQLRSLVEALPLGVACS